MLKKYIIPILLAFMFLLQQVSLHQLQQIRNELEQNKSMLVQQEMQYRHQIDTILSNVDAKLKKEASIIDSVSYEVSDLNQTMEIEVHVQLTPKESTKDTSIVIYVNDAPTIPIVMDREGVLFTAICKIPITSTAGARIVLTNNGVDKSEQLDTFPRPLEKMLPTMNVGIDRNLSHMFTQTSDVPGGEWEFSGHLLIDTQPAQNNKLENATLIILINGVIHYTQPIDPISLEAKVNRKVKVMPNQTLVMRVDAIDTFGLIHRSELETVTLNSKSEASFDHYYPDVVVLDQEENVINIGY